MRQQTPHCTLIASLSLILLATIALTINYFVFKFPGNNYFPPDTALLAILLFVALAGCYLQFGKESTAVKIAKELIYYFFVMCVIAFATNAIQLTPFPPIDKTLIAIESFMHIDVGQIVSWTINHSWLKETLIFVYDSLPYQMSILPIAVIFMRKFAYIREYYCLLLISALLGFSFYYFFPTLAPASFLQGPFSIEQYATGVKFKEIHQHISPSTIEGGMIAFPSFHVIWAWLCLYLIRWSRLLFCLLLPFNLLLIASCVLLGWHYPTDLLGSLIVLVITYLVCFYCRKKSANFSGDTAREF